MRPTSDRTEYRPPIKFLCSTKKILNFLDIKCSKLFFSAIKIKLLALFLITLSKNILDKVSMVFPDFEVTTKRTFEIVSFFLK